MNAILGKIVSVSPASSARNGKAQKLARLRVQFKAATLLPARTDVPAWLADQVLTIERLVADVREIGGPGDAIALSSAESEKWLQPLRVEPALIEGKLPKALELTLDWWKDAHPPEFAVSALGRKVSGTFARRGDHFIASVAIADVLLDGKADRSAEIEITCGDLRAVCPVIPASSPTICRFIDGRGSGYSLRNCWYGVDVSSELAGGAIVGFRERGREIDHLAITPETQKALDKVGYCDRLFLNNWDNKLAEAKLAFSVRQHETDCIRVEMDGVVDEGKNVRSAAAYRLLERLPIFVVRRDVRLGEPKPDEKKKAKEKTDSIVPVQLGFRYATTLEGDGTVGSHLVALDGDRLAVLRACHENEYGQRGDWWLRSGWTLACHPLRRQAMLFAFDGQRPPELQSWAGTGFMTFEAYWPVRPYRPPAGTTSSVALSAGEIWGAAVGGAWVACRTRSHDGTIRCAAIAKLAAETGSAGAEFQLGREKQQRPMESIFIEGVGRVYAAVAEFPRGRMSDPFDAVIAGIASRGKS